MREKPAQTHKPTLSTCTLPPATPTPYPVSRVEALAAELRESQRAQSEQLAAHKEQDARVSNVMGQMYSLQDDIARMREREVREGE